MIGYIDFTTTPPTPLPHVPQYIRDNFPAAVTLAPSVLGSASVEDLINRWTPDEKAEVSYSLSQLRDLFVGQATPVVEGKEGNPSVVGPDGAPTPEAKQYVSSLHPIAPELAADLSRPEFVIQAAGVKPASLAVSLEALHTIVLHSRPDIKATAWQSSDHSGQGMQGCSCGAVYYCGVCEPILGFRCGLIYSRVPPDLQGQLGPVLKIKNCIARSARPTPPPPPPPYAENPTEKLFEAISRNDIGAAQDVARNLSAVDVNATGKSKQTVLEAILTANKKGPWADIAYELATHPGLNVNHQDTAGRSALTLAATHGFNRVVTALLGREGIDVNSRTASKKTPLIAAVGNGPYVGGDPEVVEALLQAPGVEVNAQDEDGKTAFLLACSFKRHLVPLFLRHPATDINLEGRDGVPPFSAFVAGIYPNDDWGPVAEFAADPRLQVKPQVMASLQEKAVIPNVPAIIETLTARGGR